MVKSNQLKFQEFRPLRIICLIFSLLFSCPDLWASQEAMVLSDRAVIYSDLEMSSPIGYVSRGKKILVGDISRNKGQVYPIIVGGKIAYIRVIDVTTEKESMDSDRLTSERFQRASNPMPETQYSLSYFGFGSTINQSKQNGKTKDNDSLFWNGLTLKGEVFVKKSFDLQILVSYMTTKSGNESYRLVEGGLGAALRLIDTKRFLARVQLQALGVPFASYELGSLFRKNSFGATGGGGLVLTYLWNKNWGVEVSGGYYYTKLFKFDVPAPYQDFSASFSGVRGSLGLNYTY